MSDTTRVLILAVGKPEVSALPPVRDDAEIFLLTEKNASEALQKIFAAETVAIWGELEK